MDDAHELNRELTRMLCEAGERLGFVVAREYALPGGRLAVAWTREVPTWPRPLPVVGFEIESSWRTRKHVKGDLLNLTDAGVSLGVIVLAGDTARDDDLQFLSQESSVPWCSRRKTLTVRCSVSREPRVNAWVIVRLVGP